MLKWTELLNDSDVGIYRSRCKVEDYLFSFKRERCVASSNSRSIIFVAVGRVAQTAAEEKWFYIYIPREQELASV